MNDSNECQIKGSIKPIEHEKLKQILRQMENCICKIIKDEGQGTGFFTKIPINDNKNELVPVVITNNHVINNELINNKNIKIILNIKGKDKFQNFEMNNDRCFYTNEDLDTTIIQLKESDEINNFLELDENIINNGDNSGYKGEAVYIIQYPNGELSFSNGFIGDISRGKKYFSHSCSTEKGASGSPILKLSNNKIIGIHRAGNIENNRNAGIFLNRAIKMFQKRYSELNNNLIKNDEYSNNKLCLFQKNLNYFSMIKSIYQMINSSTLLIANINKKNINNFLNIFPCDSYNCDKVEEKCSDNPDFELVLLMILHKIHNDLVNLVYNMKSENLIFEGTDPNHLCNLWRNYKHSIISNSFNIYQHILFYSNNSYRNVFIAKPYIIFDLDEISNYFKKQINLSDCFVYERINRGYIIYHAPMFLLIILNSQNNINIGFEKYLDLSSTIENSSQIKKYTFFGMIIKNDKGYFWLMKNRDNNASEEWIAYTDEKSDKRNLKFSDINNIFINFNNSYHPKLLLYQGIN